MNVSGVDNLLAEMRAAMSVAQGGAATGPVKIPQTEFANVLKSSLDGVAQAQNRAEDLQKAFVMGDEKVTLSNVMIEMQKAEISFQTTLQVRNKMVAAYNEIMNMQV